MTDEEKQEWQVSQGDNMTNEKLQLENARLQAQLEIVSLIATSYRKIIIEALNPTTKLLKPAAKPDVTKHPRARSRSSNKKTLPTSKN